VRQDAFDARPGDLDARGVPRAPGAWLTTTARDRAVDRLRRAARESVKLREAARLAPTPPYRRGRPEALAVAAAEGDAVPDDRLRLIFTCLPPALPLHRPVALDPAVADRLSTAEIARASWCPSAPRRSG